MLIEELEAQLKALRSQLEFIRGKSLIQILRSFLLWFSPFFLFLLAIFLIAYFFRLDANKYIELVNILVWPIVILIALFFFRKVVTYLFFSMDEFNFFGAKGELKNVNYLIEERVNQRLEEERKEQEIKNLVVKYEKDLEIAKLSKESSEKKSEENFNLAKKILKEYKEVFKNYQDILQEKEEMLKKLRILQQKEERQRQFRETVRRMAHSDEPNQEEIDAAGDAWLEQQADEQRGR